MKRHGRHWAWLAAVLLLGAGSGPGVAQMHRGDVLAFVETDAAGQPPRRVSLRLTDQPATTCLGGDWKRAEVVQDPDAQVHRPAYRRQGDRLEVLLVNGACDDYDAYVGEVSGAAFRGEHVRFGMRFRKVLGQVSGSYASGAEDAAPAR